MRKRPIRLLVSLAAAAVAMTVGIGVTLANAAGTVTATFATESAWETGFGGKYTITNGSAASVTWTLKFDLPTGTTVGSFWDADITSAAITGGTRYTAVGKSWNGTLAAGASTSFGFNGAGTGRPGNCTINGASCSTGASPSPSATTASPTASPSASASPSVSPTASPSVSPTASPTNPTPGKRLVGYLPNWAQYGRNYHVKNIATSGSASKLTHILYAFANISGGRCVLTETYNDYDRAYTADQSVDGVADTWDQPLRGNFNQLLKLKAQYPQIKVLLSIGGWTYSPNFAQAAANPAAFADSCYTLAEDPRWAGVFDGLDIDWEYPNACGISCDTSGFSSFKTVMQALRARVGANYLLTAAITADGSNGGKIDAADYGGAAQYVDWYMPMSYDYFGAFSAQGPTAPHSPLTCYAGIPTAGFCTEAAITKLKAKGVPASKLLLGIGFYGRGWTGVTQSAPGGTATGPATGIEPGVQDYKVLKTQCPATGTVGGTAYAYCGNNWWSYDTPATIAGKTTWAKSQSLGGAFFWELSGDTTNGELITAVSNGLK
ncbi:chitinase [Rhizocola hellebori]|uniref:chitinase n=1 Tax=Rhizocola hellebori TaxID=1392758 RepID=A0A8J3QH29_9ACTN|nr:chitinase [Rhizocola hellebori]